MDEQTLQKPVDPADVDLAETLPKAEETAKSESGTGTGEPLGNGTDSTADAPEELPLEVPVQADDQPIPTLPPDPTADQPDPQELGRLREELTRLREEIRSAKNSLIKQEAELEEFRDLFPGVSLAALPDSVLADVQNGVPLAAAYALMERRAARLQKIAEEANAANNQRSSGSADGDSAGFLSPAEVRGMSPEQVRKHYRQILLSMPKWH